MEPVFIDGDGNEDWIKEVTRRREALEKAPTTEQKKETTEQEPKQ